MANKKISRPGSGRTAGSYSFVLIPLNQITEKFKDTTTPVKVSRKWAQECGFANLISAPAGALNSQIAGTTPTTVIEVNEVDLRD